jgi:DNA-binding protein YbaB
MRWFEAGGEAERIEHELAAKRNQWDEINSALAKHRHVATTKDNSITVVVDAHGEVVDLSIVNAALRSPHPQLIGPRIVALVRRARRAAAEARTEMVRTRLE